MEIVEGVDCVEEVVTTYPVGKEMTIAPGNILAINGRAAFRFKVLVLEGGSNGSGLLYYNAFGGKTVPVNFVDVQAYESDDSPDMGCVHKGEMPVAGSDNSVLDRDVQSRVAALLTKINDPGSFSGSFEQALEELKNKATELKDKSAVTKEDWTLLNTYIVASNKGFSDWKDEINAAFGNDIPEEVQTALTKLGEIENELKQLSSCATENIQGAGGDSYLNLTAMLRLACAMQFDKLIAEQAEAAEISGELEKLYFSLSSNVNVFFRDGAEKNKNLIIAISQFLQTTHGYNFFARFMHRENDMIMKILYL